MNIGSESNFWPGYRFESDLNYAHIARRSLPLLKISRNKVGVLENVSGFILG
jgi:hypothetical protein